MGFELEMPAQELYEIATTMASFNFKFFSTLCSQEPCFCHHTAELIFYHILSELTPNSFRFHRVHSFFLYHLKPLEGKQLERAGLNLGHLAPQAIGLSTRLRFLEQQFDT